MALLGMLKGRLAMVGLALALATVAGLYFRGNFLAAKLQRTEAREAVALAANEAQLETISALREAAARDATILRGLDEIRSGLAAVSAARRADRERISREDPDVSDYLSQPIPCGLRDNADGDADCPSPD